MGASFECEIRFRKLKKKDINLIIHKLKEEVDYRFASVNALLVYGDDPIAPEHICDSQNVTHFLNNQSHIQAKAIIFNGSIKLDSIDARIKFNIELDLQLGAVLFSFDENNLFGPSNYKTENEYISLIQLFDVWKKISNAIPSIGGFLGTEGGPLEELSQKQILRMKSIDSLFSAENAKFLIDNYWKSKVK